MAAVIYFMNELTFHSFTHSFSHSFGLHSFIHSLSQLVLVLDSGKYYDDDDDDGDGRTTYATDPAWMRGRGQGATVCSGMRLL